MDKLWIQVPPLNEQARSDFVNRVITGLVFDARLMHHRNTLELKEIEPEDPARIWAIYEKLEEAGVLERLSRKRIRQATKEELAMFHTEEYIEIVQSVDELVPLDLIRLCRQYDSIYFCAETKFCAEWSCGGMLDLCASVQKGELRNGVAIIRPPGHHAESNQAMGFCIFNNVAIAAKKLQQGYKKILILDWDIHHGNGIYRAFRMDPNVLYVSLHRYDDGNFYPGWPEDAAPEVVGDGLGTGRTVNIGWSGPKMGDADYLHAFQEIILPMLREFEPEFILVAAGFDAALGDPIGHCNVTPYCFAQMTRMLQGFANGRIVLALEGGYNLESTALSVLACTQALLGDELSEISSPSPIEEASTAGREAVKRTLVAHRHYWEFLRKRDLSTFFEELPPTQPEPNLIKRRPSVPYTTSTDMQQIQQVSSPQRSSSFTFGNGGKKYFDIENEIDVIS